ncbi:DNA polymerase II [Candidatus Woesearchaeota archaeon]|nr:DNA polymerase II [Candidatus Woesearchaeota archaeon]
MKGFVISSTYRIIDNKSYVLLYGRLENNHSFLTMNSFKPYFFIETKNLEKAKKIGNFESEKTKLTNFEKEPMTRIILDLPKELPDLRSSFEEAKIKNYESDIRFPIRFLIDNKIQSSIEVEGDYELKKEGIDRFYKEPELKRAEYTPKNLKVLSFDIESDKKGKKIYCISLYGHNYNKSLLLSTKKIDNAISCKTEKELLEEFQKEVLDFDPDIITGWNVIDFDLQFLKDKFSKYKVPFILGRDNSFSKLRIESDFFRTSKAEISGRVVLDGIDLIKSSFIKLENYKLDTAAKKLLGKGKLIETIGHEKYDEIDRLYKEDQKRLIEYNLLDAELAYRIVNEADLINLAIQRSLLTGMTLDRVNSSIASLDYLYLQKARSHNLVCPTSFSEDRESRIKGGFVKESIPGIYDNIIVLDFKSLYPSVIRTFNIDPTSFSENKTKNSIESPNKAYFINEEGILPEIIEELWRAREKSRKEKNELSRYAIKILMNSFFGVLANPSCRFYNLKIANAITHFGQYLIKRTAKLVEEMNYKVIYSDTDSLFIDTNSKTPEDAERIGKHLEKQINEFYKKTIKKEYNRESHLELEYEKCYIRFLMPKLRGSDSGAKKRYAGIIIKEGKEELQFVGLEFIRSDWTNAAKKFQEELLDRVFHKKEVTIFVKNFVDNLKSGKYDKDLIYRKSLRKGLEGYSVSPPHLKAAKKLKKLDSDIIEYYITLDGPEPIQELKHKIDYEHYIKKQIKPIADAILEFYNTTFDDLIEGTKQTSLFSFKK